MLPFLGCSLLMFSLPVFGLVSPGEQTSTKGTCRFVPMDKNGMVIPQPFRMEAREFLWKKQELRHLKAAGVTVSKLEFPSAVVSPYECNNTVHAEYYRPDGAGPFPAILVLDIMGGDQKVSRLISNYFAQNGVACLFVQMAYYGPRRPPNGLRLITPNLEHTFAGIRQTVLDCRLAAAWLAAQPEVDANRLGMLGTSLGSFMTALTVSAEPRLERVALLLGGGGLVDAYYNHPKAKLFVRLNEAMGGSADKLKGLIAPFDPLTYAKELAAKDLFLVGARRDEIVPPQMCQKLWEATGKQGILWVDATHVGAALYGHEILPAALQHFRKPVDTKSGK